MVDEKAIPPYRVGPLSEEDVLPAGTKAKEGSLLIADKGAPVITPCVWFLAAAMHLPPPRDEARLHASCFQRGRCLHAHSYARGLRPQRATELGVHIILALTT